MSARRQVIAARFGAAAATYDTASGVQRIAAQKLAARLADLPAPQRVLEIGCGTGHVYQALRALLQQHGRRAPDEWWHSDIALPMVEVCRKKLPGRFVVMDGERPCLKPASFDWLVSSLAAQWFTDLPAALPRLVELLAPQGRVLLTTLGACSLREWRQAHQALGLTAATPDYPDAAALAAAFAPGLLVTLHSELLTLPLANPIDFLRDLRAIGADTPRAGHRPLSAGQLKAVLRRLDAAHSTLSYEILRVEAVRND